MSDINDLVEELKDIRYSLVESRPSCLSCVLKHLSQSAVLMEEARQGYPLHRWLAVGHLAEASAESVMEYPALAAEIRKHRLKYADDEDYEVPIMDLIEAADKLSK